MTRVGLQRHSKKKIYIYIAALLHLAGDRRATTLHILFQGAHRGGGGGAGFTIFWPGQDLLHPRYRSSEVKMRPAKRALLWYGEHKFYGSAK